MERSAFNDFITSGKPILALAPMQDVTDLHFWRVISAYGGADLYYTEYFRVHGDSRLDKPILRSIVENPTGRPVIAQMIGNDIPALVRTALELQKHPVIAIDLNLGCPAPVVYRKCAGGGLLREPARVDAILGALRQAISIPFTVKTRLGFDDTASFDNLLAIFSRHSIDLLTVHGRTVSQMYRRPVYYDLIARAAALLPCPVLANGDIQSARKAADVLNETKAAGLMIGRGAIRNPWLFDQIRAHSGNTPGPNPSGRDLLHYVRILYEAVSLPTLSENAQVQHMKKFMTFFDLDPEGRFLHAIRRATSKSGFFNICESFLDHDSPVWPDPPTPALKSCA